MILDYLLPLLVQLIFFVCPIASIVFFVVSLIRYRSAKKQYSQPSGSETLKKRKTRLIVSSVLVAVFLTVAVAFIVLLSMAVAFM